VEDFLRRLDYAIGQWRDFGNQETEWIESYLWDSPPQEFLVYEQICSELGLGTLLDYGDGCDLLENFLDCVKEGVAPSEGWRFKLLVALNSLSWEQRHRTGDKPHIWGYIARPLNGQTKEACEAFLGQFCVIGEWKSDDRGDFCSIEY